MSTQQAIDPHNDEAELIILPDDLVAKTEEPLKTTANSPEDDLTKAFEATEIVENEAPISFNPQEVTPVASNEDLGILGGEDLGVLGNEAGENDKPAGEDSLFPLGGDDDKTIKNDDNLNVIIDDSIGRMKSREESLKGQKEQKQLDIKKLDEDIKKLQTEKKDAAKDVEDLKLESAKIVSNIKGLQQMKLGNKKQA